jgi:hypothetical protein
MMLPEEEQTNISSSTWNDPLPWLHITHHIVLLQKVLATQLASSQASSTGNGYSSAQQRLVSSIDAATAGPAAQYYAAETSSTTTTNVGYYYTTMNEGDDDHTIIPMVTATPIIDATLVETKRSASCTSTDNYHHSQQHEGTTRQGFPAFPPSIGRHFDRAELYPKYHCCNLLCLLPDPYFVLSRHGGNDDDDAPSQHWTNGMASTDILSDLDWTDDERSRIYHGTTATETRCRRLFLGILLWLVWVHSLCLSFSW